MSTALATPAASGFDGGGGGSMDTYTELGETLGAVANEIDSASTVDTPGGEAGGDSSQPYSPVEDAPGGESPTNTETGLVKAEGPFPVTEDGSSYIVPKTEFADYNGLREYANSVQSHFPTVQDAQFAYDEATDFRNIKYDFESGSPELIDNAIRYWTGAHAQDPYMRQRFQQSFAVMAQRIPQFLQQINPQAHQHLQRSMAQPLIEQAYMRAAQIVDPAEQKAAFQAAQGFDWSVNGKYKTELPKYDPNAEARAAQQRAEQQRQQSIAQREQQLLQRDFTSFDGAVLDGPMIGQVNAEIDKQLAPIKAKTDESEFGQIRNAVLNELTAKLKSDQNWWELHLQEWKSMKAAFEQCWKTGQDPRAMLGQRAQYYINDLMVRARRVIPSIAAPQIQKFTNRKVTQPNPSNTTARPRTQTPPNAAPEKNGNENLRTRDDPEFSRLFKIAG